VNNKEENQITEYIGFLTSKIGNLRSFEFWTKISKSTQYEVKRKFSSHFLKLFRYSDMRRCYVLACGGITVRIPTLIVPQ
jgi:hypothetical protein